MWKRITKNFWIKLFCLLSATILWIYIAAGQNTIGKYPGSLKIKAINLPSGLIANYDVNTVEIKVMAEPGVWSKLSSDTFSAYVDLSSHSEGTYEFPVNVVSSTPGVQIVEKNPEKILVSLEPVIQKEISINKKTEGSAAEGLVAGTIDLDVSKVVVRGPKSIIDNITEATAVIALNGEADKFTKKISLAALDEKGEKIGNITFDPPEVNASVLIVKASNNKSVGIKVKTEGYAKTGYFVSNISVTPSIVDITGPTSLLSDVNYVETNSIDLTNSSSDFEKEVGLSLKSGLALQAGTQSKVRVKITFGRAEVTRELAATINPVNLPANFGTSSMSPSEVRVMCSGSAEVINNLKASDIVLNLDFQDKKVTEPRSSIVFEISPANFKVPEGISIASVLPSSVIVVVDKR